jgi:hypothetical protein
VSTPRIVIARLGAVRRVLQHPSGAAVILKNGDVVVIEPAVARLAADIATADRRPGDETDAAIVEAARVGRL